MTIVVRQTPCIIMSIKTETVWKKFADCFEIPFPVLKRLLWFHKMLTASYAYNNVL